MITAKRGQNIRDFNDKEWGLMPSTKYGWVEMRNSNKKPEQLKPDPPKATVAKPKRKPRKKKEPMK